MIYKMHNGAFVTVREENIRTQKRGECTLASVEVVTSSTAGNYQYTCSTAARSCRLARVAMKQELIRAKAMGDKPGYTH
jgi:hypothetical protein